jgi:predicted nucleic acid-binding protein
MIAACAHRAEAGVLHYDRDFDLIAEHTSLVFESEWLVEAG